ncbi:MAG TPA: hypothetical protein VHG09_10715, partial [Longimicrobiales bacterium]|nr:hypothetical protein [Longimicrobiales bacterium]
PVATDLGDVQLAARLHGIARAIGTPLVTRDDGAEDNGVADDGAADDGAEDDLAEGDIALIRRIAFETIGIDPDASRGRLRLRPRLNQLDELHVRSIRFSDGSISLHADRTDDVLSIRVQQDAGSIPITLLLEPFVNDPGPATVDGQPADLTPLAVHDGTILPVQLVLDEERTLTVRVGEIR